LDAGRGVLKNEKEAFALLLPLASHGHPVAQYHIGVYYECGFGVSPDYAVIAQKAGDASTVASFDAVFDKEYGLTLELLANRYQERFDVMERKTQMLEARLNRIWKLLEPLKWAQSLFKK
jgi:TPR repeat protein